MSSAPCDNSITLTPLSTYDTGTATFKVTALTLSGLNSDTTTVTTENCNGKWFKITAYDSDKALVQFNASATTDYLQFQIPATSANSDASWNSPTGTTGGVTFPTHTDWYNGTRTTNALIKVGNFTLSNSVATFTLESADSASS